MPRRGRNVRELSGDNQDENVATIKVRTRGRERYKVNSTYIVTTRLYLPFAWLETQILHVGLISAIS